jgi:hypothetical protein
VGNAISNPIGRYAATSKSILCQKAASLFHGSCSKQVEKQDTLKTPCKSGHSPDYSIIKKKKKTQELFSTVASTSAVSAPPLLLQNTLYF